jgi:hypothetical protein
MTISDKDRKGYLMIAAAGFVVVIFFVAKLALGNKPKPGADGCFSPNAAETVLVLDHSEALSDQTRNEIAARAMAHVRDHVVTNERVTVFFVSQLSKKSLLPAFSRCKPPQDGNRAYEDSKGISKAYQRTFLEPLDVVLKTAPSNGKESPIAQALIDISLSQYLRGKRNTLLVYSDMIESTPKFSLYTCVAPQQSVALFREARKGAQERPKFSNTSVVLNIIPRQNISKATLKCRDEVWGWFFGDSDGQGSRLDLEYLPGA